MRAIIWLINKIKIGIKYMDKNLLIKLCIFEIVAVILLIIGIHNINNNVNKLFVVIDILAGLCIGMFFGSILKITWQENSKKAIGKKDLIGLIFTVAYYLFIIYRKKLFSNWFIGDTLKTICVWITFGIMMGQDIIHRRNVTRTLKQNIRKYNKDIKK